MNNEKGLTHGRTTFNSISYKMVHVNKIRALNKSPSVT